MRISESTIKRIIAATCGAAAAILASECAYSKNTATPITKPAIENFEKDSIMQELERLSSSAQTYIFLQNIENKN